MMQIGLFPVNTSAMWALLSLVIPLLIHLFNRSHGRLVKIGHIDLVRRAKQLQVTEVRLSQWWLLVTRLGIFAILALLLAGLSSSNIVMREHTAIYLSPSWLNNAPQEELNAILEQSDTEPGSTIQLLATGFPGVDRSFLAKREEQFVEPTNIWPLLLEKLETENHLGPVQVYASDFASQFGAQQAALPRPVNWNLGHPATSSMIDSRPYHAVMVHQSDRAAEVKRLEDVFSVIKKYRLPALTWESVAAEGVSAAGIDCDWLIILTDGLTNGPTNRMWVGSVKTPLVVMTVAGRPFNERRLEYIDVPFYPWSQFGLLQISEPADGIAAQENSNEWQVLLKTGQGKTLLQQRRIGNTRHMQLNSRLDPEWTNLVHQAEFPELFLQLLLDDNLDAERFPEARVNVNVLQDHYAPSPIAARAEKQPLHQWLVLILVLLWVLERWLSERRPRAAG